MSLMAATQQQQRVI